MSITVVAVTVLALVAFWPIVAYFLSRAAQPLRLELAERGEAFLQNSDIPPVFRRRVEFMLDHAFGMRGFLLVSIAATAPLSLAFLVNPSWFSRFGSGGGALDDHRRHEFDEIDKLHQIIVFLNNPLLAAFDGLFATCIFEPALFLRAIVDARFPARVGLVRVFLETQPRKLIPLLGGA